MKILVTCFEAFGEDQMNPSLEVVKGLPCHAADAEIIKLQLPVVFHKAVEILTAVMEQENPDYILSLGQAAGRSAINVERVAINVDDAKIPDNEGNQPVDVPINTEGPAAYFATIPVKEIVAGIKAKGIPAVVSDSAGTFLCNHLMYGVLDTLHKKHSRAKAGFIHIPYLPEQVLEKPNVSSMSLDNMICAIEAALTVLANKGGSL